MLEFFYFKEWKKKNPMEKNFPLVLNCMEKIPMFFEQRIAGVLPNIFRFCEDFIRFPCGHQWSQQGGEWVLVRQFVSEG